MSFFKDPATYTDADRAMSEELGKLPKFGGTHWCINPEDWTVTPGTDEAPADERIAAGEAFRARVDATLERQRIAKERSREFNRMLWHAFWAFAEDCMVNASWWGSPPIPASVEPAVSD